MGYCKLFKRICTGSECEITPPDEYCEYYRIHDIENYKSKGENYV